MNSSAADLARWVPRLLAVFRGIRGDGAGRRARRPPSDRLSPDELEEVARAVRRLSQGLTRDRALAGERYLDDPRLLGAYLLFYWPTSYLQARSVLSELVTRPLVVLDLGSGPGAVAFAALDAGASEVVAADRSARALAAARSLATAAGRPLATRGWDPSRQTSLARLAGGRSFDLVAFGHVVNELFAGENAPERRAALLAAAAALLRPGGSALAIEPALRETSRKLLAVRDRLVAEGFTVRAPCLFRGPCPALVRETDWCHAERAIEPPPMVADIARAAGLRREAVKMSYLVLAPRDEGWAPPPRGRVFRIVSEPLPSKGRLRYMGCGPEGRLGLALQEKDVTDRNRAFERLLRGDVVELTEVEPRGDGLRLSGTSEVRVVARAGEPLRGHGPGPPGTGSS
ncbi:MAG TPA: small ribosomal subunit Rsm22 family protein [Anaeromyxobacteraceae bacterium]|nr:small ribosomal subunit Rsm22 family protein [Anaeromyxobacteraceae bacterium]